MNRVPEVASVPVEDDDARDFDENDDVDPNIFASLDEEESPSDLLDNVSRLIDGEITSNEKKRSLIGESSSSSSSSSSSVNKKPKKAAVAVVTGRKGKGKGKNAGSKAGDVFDEATQAMVSV